MVHDDAAPTSRKRISLIQVRLKVGGQYGYLAEAKARKENKDVATADFVSAELNNSLTLNGSSSLTTQLVTAQWLVEPYWVTSGVTRSWAVSDLSALIGGDYGPQSPGFRSNLRRQGHEFFVSGVYERRTDAGDARVQVVILPEEVLIRYSSGSVD